MVRKSPDANPVFDALVMSNPNSLWGALVAEVLVRLGLSQVVISPGSRSAPLAFALSRHSRLDAISALDERSAGFLALSLGRRSGKPVAVVCTSGTALANLYPAVIEAREAALPLLLLTADRPPELRHCLAGQAIDQSKLFGSYTLFSAELSLPGTSSELLGHLRSLLSHAWERMLGELPGPVHLNFPFREPLAPVTAETEVRFELGFEIDDFARAVVPLQRPRAGQVEFPAAYLKPKKGVIVAGQLHGGDGAAQQRAALKLARHLGWPILADVLGPWRHHSKSGAPLVCRYDTILRNPKIAQRLMPEVVIQLGPLPTSKVLRAWLRESACPRLIVEPSARNIDPLHGEVSYLRAPIEVAVESLEGSARKPGNYTKRWLEAEDEVERALQREMEQCDFNFEGKVAWLLSGALPEETPIFLASSMPVRDAEYFWRPSARGYRVDCNRGANGIDGTLSSALGHVWGAPFGVLLTGDLALLHDSNGFLLRERLAGHLTVVVINNQGSGIFETLSIARFEPPFEAFFATPQIANFERLAAAYGADYMKVAKLEDLVRLMKSFPARGIRVLEVETDRKRDASFRESVFNTVAGRLKLT